MSTLRHTLLLAAVAFLAACSLDAKNPRAITEPDLDNSEALVALVNGVAGEYDQSYQRSVLLSGLLSDEVRASGTWPAWADADKKGVINLDAPIGDGQSISHDWWLPLQRARYLAEDTHARLVRSVAAPTADPLVATARLYSGLAYRDIGEYFCEAAYNGGPKVDRASSLALARTHLSEAVDVAAAAKVDSIARMARLARARVNFSLGDLDAALADARAVPDGFVYVAHYRDQPEEFNRAFVVLNETAQGTIQEEFVTLGDPRVVVKRNGTALDKVTARWDQQKFTKYADMTLGKWQEARLIEAEILIERGEVINGVTLINRVRTAAKLAPLSTSLSVAEARAALRAERKAEFFLEAKRMLDMRRWNEFPGGWQASCVPLPRSEVNNNPNL